MKSDPLSIQSSSQLHIKGVCILAFPVILQTDLQNANIRLKSCQWHTDGSSIYSSWVTVPSYDSAGFFTPTTILTPSFRPPIVVLSRGLRAVCWTTQVTQRKWFKGKKSGHATLKMGTSLKAEFCGTQKLEIIGKPVCSVGIKNFIPLESCKAKIFPAPIKRFVSFAFVTEKDRFLQLCYRQEINPVSKTFSAIIYSSHSQSVVRGSLGGEVCHDVATKAWKKCCCFLL